MDEEAWQAVRAHAVARRVLPRAWLKTFFAQWRQAVRPDSEQRRQELLWDVGELARLNLQIAWCRYGMDAQAKMARDAAWQAKQRWMEGQADSMARLQETGDWAATWSAVRKLVGRKKRLFRPPVPLLGDDGRPLASARAHEGVRRKLCRIQRGGAFDKGASRQAGSPGSFHQVADGHVCVARHGARMGRCFSRSFQAQVRSCVWARRHSFGVDCSRRPGISPGARRLMCQDVEGKCSDVVKGRRYGGCSSQARATHAKQYERSFVLQLSRKVVRPMSAGMSQTGAVRGGGTELAIMTRRKFFRPSSTWIFARPSTPFC